jgi:hypothetical protein
MQLHIVAWWPMKPLMSDDHAHLHAKPFWNDRGRKTLPQCSEMSKLERNGLFENCGTLAYQATNWSGGGESACVCVCVCVHVHVCVQGIATVELNHTAKGWLRLWNAVKLCEWCGSESVKYCNQELCQNHKELSTVDSHKLANKWPVQWTTGGRRCENLWIGHMGPEYQVHKSVQCDLFWPIPLILVKILSQLPNHVIS